MRGRAALGLALLFAAGAALAQQVEVAERDALRCLGVKAGAPPAPEFPPREFQNRERGGVQVLLEFSAPDRGPRVTVQENTGQEAFVEAVREHVKDLRVPCLQPGEPPLRVVRDFVFRPDDRQVHWFRDTDADASARRRALACVVHARGPGYKTPTYPESALRAGVQGRVLARLRFEGPDTPPVVELAARRSARLLEGAVESWADGLRMPCHPGQGPVTGLYTLVFTFEGARHYGFTELTFRALLGGTRGIREQTLSFDTTTMGCPFEVDFHYRRPQWPNSVGEVGTRDPARRPLLEWLQTVEFDLKSELLDAIHGDTARVLIPCIRLDLKPKE